MIPVLREVAQLNIRYRKKWGPIIDVSTGPHLTKLWPCYSPGIILIKKPVSSALARARTCMFYYTPSFVTFFK